MRLDFTLLAVVVVPCVLAAPRMSSIKQPQAAALTTTSPLSASYNITKREPKQRGHPHSKAYSSASISSGTTTTLLPTATAVISSSVITTTATTAPATTTAASTTTDSNCSCGYVLDSYDSAYYPLALVLSFSSISTADLSAYGWTVTVDEEVGGDNGANVCLGSADNVAIVDGLLTLTMPGGQTGGTMNCAEITFGDDLTGGVFTTEAMLDATVGTCQSVFTYHSYDDAGDVNDEQDIEIVMSTPEYGIQLTNWDPSDTTNTINDNTEVPFPANLTEAYHNYTLAWLSSGTEYFFDGAELNGPTEYSSVNPSSLVINNWSNGGDFTFGPPVGDVVMKVKSVSYYYQTSTVDTLPSGCTLDDACHV